jgi:SatD family (SatD)
LKYNQKRLYMIVRSQKYLLLGDVVNSRHIAKRKPFEKKLAAVLNKVAIDYKKYMEAPLTNWKGIDEVAAIIKPAAVYGIINEINNDIYPQRMRFVLIKGFIDIAPGLTDITKMDGVIFHEAVNSMNVLKKEKNMFKQVSGNAAFDTAFNNQVNLLMLMKKRWTEKQHHLYAAYALGNTQEEIARKMKITQQTVSKTLKSIDAEPVLELEKSMQQWNEAQTL